MRTLVLRLFIALVITNAVIGSSVLIAGGVDGTGGKVFATSLLTTAATLVAIACSTGLRASRLRAVAIAGFAATATWFGMAVVSIWAETDAAWAGKLVGSALLVSALAAGISLVSLAQLAPRHRWVHRLGVTLATVLVGAVLVIIWWEPAATDWYLRCLGVLAVAVAAIVLIIPALHRTAQRERRTRETARTPVRYCPVCGSGTASSTSCAVCGVGFAVTLTAPPWHEPDADVRDADGHERATAATSQAVGGRS